MVADAALRLERGGADFVVLCSNTMHKLAEQVERAVAIPLLHIADATAREVKAAGVRRVGLLGTLHDGTGLLQRPPGGALWLGGTGT